MLTMNTTATILYIDEMDNVFIEWSDGKLSSFSDTGVTRAKKVLIIVGSKKALAMAVRNMNVQKRNTMLTDRIKQQFVGVIS